MHDDAWEHGSDFHYQDAPLRASGEPTPPGATAWHCGRDALVALARFVDARRVLFPSYYCQDVALAVRESGRHVVAYPSAPGAPGASSLSDVRAGDLVVVSNTFGLENRPRLGHLASGALLAEDHTHDPFSSWSAASRADFAFASLRKSLPLPDGAWLWSPRGKAVPSPPSLTARAAEITLARLSAMLMKASYLAGGDVAKETVRALAVAGERGFGTGEPSAMSPIAAELLRRMPVRTWRAQRAENHRAFCDALGASGDVEVLTSGAEAPFVVALRLHGTGEREALRAKLIAARVYPAVLWPIAPLVVPGTTSADAELSGRILCLHCDARYDAETMRIVARVVRGALAAGAT